MLSLLTDLLRGQARLSIVEANTGKAHLDSRRLYAAYQEAWRQFCSEVAVWQSLLSSEGNGAATEAAKNRAAQAELRFRENRNLLAEFMIAHSGIKVSDPLPSVVNTTRLRSASETHGKTFQRQTNLQQVAYRFWQEGGKRQGTAEADWHRAEELVYK